MADEDRETKRYSLKEREYRGEDGKIHHHTHVWMEEHAGESGGDNESGSRGKSGGQRASASRGGSAERSASGKQGGSRGSSARKTGGRSQSSGRSESSGQGESSGRSESDREEETGGEGGGMGRVMMGVGVAAMAAAAFMVGRRLRNELDAGDRARRDRSQGERLGNEDFQGPRAVRDEDDGRTGSRMY
jgi:cobalamin biosynthesis Mg chelatase CobN